MRGQRPLPPDETSVLDAVGGEIVAIVSPVSICMMCCVFLVRLLRVDGEDATANVRGGIASAAYQEESSDSTAVRAGGAVLPRRYVLGAARPARLPRRCPPTGNGQSRSGSQRVPSSSSFA